MRSLPPDLAPRVASKIQTPAANSDPGLVARITRPEILLTSDDFLERQMALTGASALTAVDIAVRHPRRNRNSDKIYIAYVDDGVGKVISAKHATMIGDHTWMEENFEEPATDIAVAFDGYTPTPQKQKTEFISQGEPWIFWCNSDGELYAYQLNANMNPVELAMSNCTKVTAVRATYADGIYDDFGLVCFFILNGTIYYRQYIKGTWYDAETVTFGSAGVTWTDISARRTADYRVCLQALDSNGNLYELFTQFQGIGKHGTEHIEISDIRASGTLTRIRYTNAFETEHISISGISAAGTLTWGISSSVTSIQNIEDEDENWGTTITITFDHPLHGVTSGAISNFTVEDDNAIGYGVTAIALSQDGLTITLTVNDFNLAALSTGLTVTYTPGSIMSPVAALNGFTRHFEPTGLEAPQVDPPEVSSIINY